MKLVGKILFCVALVAVTAAVTFCVTVYMFGKSYGSPSYAKLQEICGILNAYFIDEYDEDALLDAAETAMGDAGASAMIEAAGDEWSYYLSAEEYEKLKEESGNSYVGIGVKILADEEAGGFVITEVTSGGPADLGGVRVGDVLLKVEGESVLALGQEETVARVQGEAGTEVRLSFLREGEVLDLTLVRNSVKRDVATLNWAGKVAVIKITNFQTYCAEQTLGAVETALREKAEGIVFDVRNDPGGYESELLTVLDRLLPEGVIFRSRDYAGREETETSDALCVELPMAVLVNEETYSAAEFFAAALQEYGAAAIVGTPTYGKGNYQWMLPLSDGSAVNISVGKYFTPKGVSLSGVGITPDVKVEVEDEEFYQLYYGILAPEDDAQLQAALEAVRKAA